MPYDGKLLARARGELDNIRAKNRDETQRRYNEVLPTIPVYSNIYYDFYTPYLQNYVIPAQVTWSQAILLAYFGLPETEAPADEMEAIGDDEAVFD